MGPAFAFMAPMAGSMASSMMQQNSQPSLEKNTATTPMTDISSPAPPPANDGTTVNINSVDEKANAFESAGGAMLDSVASRAGSEMGNAAFGDAGDQALEYMNKVYPGTSPIARLEGGAGNAGSKGIVDPNAKLEANTKLRIAKISANASKYQADKNLEGTILNNQRLNLLGFGMNPMAWAKAMSQAPGMRTNNRGYVDSKGKRHSRSENPLVPSKLEKNPGYSMYPYGQFSLFH